jgi:release factor glutamine methyltransferase
VIDARLLVEAASGASRVDIITDPHRQLSEDQALALEALVARREKREPVSHILGARGFWKIMLKVTPDVLTPRPDTESLLDVLLPKISRSDQRRAASAWTCRPRRSRWRAKTPQIWV